MNRAVTQERSRARMRASTVACLFAVCGTGCGEPESGPEEQLRQWVSEGQEAVEKRKARAMLDLISPAYIDGRQHNRADIGNLLRAYFLRQRNIRLMTSIDEVRLYGETAAELELTVRMTGTNDSVFGFSADTVRFFLELESVDNEWLLISARWGAPGEELY